jgi:hypothetical protein
MEIINMRIYFITGILLLLSLASVSCEREQHFVDWVEVTTERNTYASSDTVHVHIKNNGDVPINIDACHGELYSDIEMLETIVWETIGSYNFVCDDSGIPFVTLGPGESKEQGHNLRGDWPAVRYRLKYHCDIGSERHLLFSNTFTIR